MNSLKNSSELLESAGLIGDLLINIPESLPYDVFHDVCPPADRHNLDATTSLFETSSDQHVAAQQPATQDTLKPHPADEAVKADSDYVGDQLDTLLSNLCRQSGFHSAVVADNQGLPIGGYNTPIFLDQLAAFSSVLGTVIERVPHFFEHHDANNISIDINYIDKAVVRKFLIKDLPFFLLVICSQDIDERAYIELFSEQIAGLLQR